VDAEAERLYGELEPRLRDEYLNAYEFMTVTGA
jgi:hypothetical protein